MGTNAQRNRVGSLGVAIVGLAALSGMSVFAQEAILIDHECTDVSLIPPVWVDAAKTKTLHYAHTSHGSQLISGADRLEQLDPFFSIAVRESGVEGLPPIEDPPALRVYDGNPPDTYITPDEYWESEAGRNRTRAVCDTGNYDFSMWAWCGQASYYSDAQIQLYLDTMLAFEAEYPQMRFVLMTGHTDGTGLDGNLHRHNEMIRQFAVDHGMILFDFADIESHDPDGNDYLALGCNDNGDYDGGNWPQEWCTAHPGDALCAGGSCAHSQAIICNLKGRALWWMMARLAGWPGLDGSTGDLNCDGAVDFQDINPFVLALSGQTAYEAQFPTCIWMNADCNQDGSVDFEDINPFVALLGS